jgi:hypothetical protein
MLAKRIVTSAVVACTAFAVNAFAAPAGETDKYVAGQPAVGQWFPTVREAADGLPGHTVFRPADMTRFSPNSVPVIVWANGACRTSNLGFMVTLTSLANHGFVVIANGDFDAPINVTTNVEPESLTEAINWAMTGNNHSQFLSRLATTKIGVAGQSCGGEEALVAAADPRVVSLAGLNTGFFPTPLPFENGYSRANLANIHVPTLMVNGGPSDVAYQNSIDNYNLINAPAYLASTPHASHSGLWFGIRDGNGDVPMANQGVVLLVNWFDFTLNADAEAARYFFGPNCGLCAQPAPYNWIVTSKNWP